MGKNMKHALAFIKQVSGWHSFSNDRATKEAVKRLEVRGLVVVNQFNQFRLA